MKNINFDELPLESYGSVEVNSLFGKDYKWWSRNHDDEIKEFALENLQTETFEEKLKLYEFAFMQDSENGRIYLVMIHQLYFEMLEYFFLLVHTFNFPLNTLPITISKPSTTDILKYVKDIVDSTVYTQSDTEMMMTSGFYIISKHITDSTTVIDGDQSLVFWPFYMTMFYSSFDFTDDDHRNVYNSIKHGNRGVTRKGEIRYGPEQTQKDLIVTDYSYRHSQVKPVKGSKNDLYIRNIATYLSSDQVIKRAKIVLTYIRYMHFIYKSSILEDYTEEPVNMSDVKSVREAWKFEDRQGSFVKGDVVHFKKSAENEQEAEVKNLGYLKVINPARFGPEDA